MSIYKCLCLHSVNYVQIGTLDKPLGNLSHR